MSRAFARLVAEGVIDEVSKHGYSFVKNMIRPIGPSDISAAHRIIEALDLHNITGSIYFVQVGLEQPIKIGYSNNTKKRISAIQTGSPYKLNLIVCFPGSKYVEHQVHEAFKTIKLNGEWFRPDPVLLAFIQLLKELRTKLVEAQRPW